MTDTSIPLQNQVPHHFNESEGNLKFFDGVLKKVEEAKIHSRTMLETKELMEMIINMRKQMERNEIILGSMNEQQAFLAKIESFLMNPGAFDPVQIKENLQTIIDEEFIKGVSRAERRSLGLDYKKSSDGFNFRAIGENTVIVPMDLHLAFLPTDTVEHVYSRLLWQYANRAFNAIILLSIDKRFRGIIKLESLQRAMETNKHMLLGEMGNDTIYKFGYLKTSNQETERNMDELWINIFPIISPEGLLIGILTREQVSFMMTRFYIWKSQYESTQLGARVEESLLKTEINAGHAKETPAV